MQMDSLSKDMCWMFLFNRQRWFDQDFLFKLKAFRFSQNRIYSYYALFREKFVHRGDAES